MGNKASLFLLLIPLIISCSKKDYIKNPERIVDFHRIISTTTYGQLDDSVDLYIDYSSCVVEAVRSSQFFGTLRPNLMGFNPVMWSIKGKIISRESGNQDTINNLLNNITEINFADLVGAVHQIAIGDHQAVLVTDGEYWTQPEGERTDLPYMLNDFKKWLTRGFEIFVLVEPYQEKYKGKTYDKQRFYFLFTDSSIQDNIVDRLENLINFSTFSEIRIIKISSTDFGIETEYAGVNQPDVNQVLALNTATYKKGYRYEFQEYQIDWKSIEEFVRDAPDSVTGNPIPGGDYLFRGIFVNSSGIEYYKIENIDIKVYNIYDEFRGYEDTLISPEQLQAQNKFTELQEIFIIDDQLFQKSGEIGVKFHPNFTGSGLNKKGDDPEKENLFRVDIVISKAYDNFTERINDFGCLKWASINQPGRENTSVYESIKQLIQDPAINPVNVNAGVLYTIYIKTPCFE